MVKKKDIFFCIGAQKSGTTSLHDILSQNVNIALPKKKETHFFSIETLFCENKEAYFNRCFHPKEISKAKLIGEIDPSYCYFDSTEKRIFDTLSKSYNIKFIFILRDPVKRAYSHYLMSKRRGYETLTFKEAIKNEEKRITIDHFSNVNFSYLSRGHYSLQIKRYLNYFDKKNFLFLRFEDDFIENKEHTFNRISEHLGLDYFDYNFNILSNPASEPKSRFVRDLIFKDNMVKSAFFKIMPSKRIRSSIKKSMTNLNLKKAKQSKLDDSDLKDIYNNFYKNEIDTLEKLTKLDLSTWKHD